MPYSTPMQIAILDELMAKLGLDPDAWVRDQAMFASEPAVQGIADLRDTDAALLILMCRRMLEAQVQRSQMRTPETTQSVYEEPAPPRRTRKKGTGE